jgi:hypothetical protein
MVLYNALTTPPGGSGNRAITNGAISLPGPTDNSSFFYALKPQPLAPADTFSYEIAEAPIFPAGSTRPAQHPEPNGDIISIIRKDTETDYVFLGNIGGIIFKDAFYVLKVTDKEIDPPEPGDDGSLVINVIGLSIADKTFTLSPSTATFSQATLEGAGSKVVTVTLNDSGNVFTNIKWILGGRTWTGATLSIDFGDPANVDLLVIGQYTITIEATTTDGGVPYSANLTVVITQ